MIVGNVGTLTGGMVLLPGAEPDDGQLDVAVLTPVRAYHWVGLGGRIARFPASRLPVPAGRRPRGTSPPRQRSGTRSFRAAAAASTRSAPSRTACVAGPRPGSSAVVSYHSVPGARRQRALRPPPVARPQGLSCLLGLETTAGRIQPPVVAPSCLVVAGVAAAHPPWGVANRTLPPPSRRSASVQDQSQHTVAAPCAMPNARPRRTCGIPLRGRLTCVRRVDLWRAIPSRSPRSRRPSRLRSRCLADWGAGPTAVKVRGLRVASPAVRLAPALLVGRLVVVQQTVAERHLEAAYEQLRHTFVEDPLVRVGEGGEPADVGALDLDSPGNVVVSLQPNQFPQKRGIRESGSAPRCPLAALQLDRWYFMRPGGLRCASGCAFIVALFPEPAGDPLDLLDHPVVTLGPGVGHPEPQERFDLGPLLDRDSKGVSRACPRPRTRSGSLLVGALHRLPSQHRIRSRVQVSYLVG